MTSLRSAGHDIYAVWVFVCSILHEASIIKNPRKYLKNDLLKESQMEYSTI